MSIYKDYHCPDRLLEAIHGLLEQVPSATLIDFARSYPSFQSGGFMIRPGKTAPIISRILQLVSAAEPVDPSLLRFLARNNGAGAVLSALSSDFIADHLIPLNRAFGDEPMLLARLLDNREKVRSVALKETPAAEESVLSAEERDARRAEALATLREALSPALAALGVAAGEGASALRDIRDVSELKELRAEVKRLHGAEIRLAAEAQKRREAEASRDEFRKKAETLDAEARMLRQRIEKAEAEQKRCANLVERHAEERLQQRLAEEFSKWLGGRYAEQLRELLPAIPVGEGDGGKKDAHAQLVASATAALEKQSKADAVSGVRDVLERRLCEIQSLYRRSLAAHANALRPTRELEESMEALRKEAERLERILHFEASSSDVSPVDALASAVNGARERELPKWAQIADSLREIGVLDENERDRIEAAIRCRYAAMGLENVELAFEEGGDPQTPAGILRHALLGRRPLLLLIDAHNVLFALQSRYQVPSDHHFPGAKAREWLVEDVIQMTVSAPNCRVFVVFDGPVRSEASPAPNVNVIYSGGEGEHRADNVLIEEAEFLLGHGDKGTVILVTNDNGLIGRAARLGVLNLSPAALFEFL
jgi:hypothetical protein